jgi:hypothetical protein
MESTQNIYIESSIPAGLTIAEYRRQRPQRPSLWKRFLGRHDQKSSIRQCPSSFTSLA